MFNLVTEQTQALRAERELTKKLQARIKELEEVLTRIQNWAKAYPLEVFPPPDLKKAAQVLKAEGLTLDAITADAIRYVITEVSDIARQALGD